MQLEDIELVKRSQNGDLGAFNMIVERYQTQVFNVAARLLGNPTSAEDAAQETFISAYRAIKSFHGGSLRAWLLRIATNASYDLMRSSRRRSEESLDRSMENPGFQQPLSGDSPEQIALKVELSGEIQKAILALPEDQRAVMVMIDIQELSYEEAAQATGASLGTVKSRLSRARARVRDYLMQHRELLPEQFRRISEGRIK
jgi:RNA polymerase sigma-70 factor (ECF subfamily)